MIYISAFVICDFWFSHFSFYLFKQGCCFNGQMPRTLFSYPFGRGASMKEKRITFPPFKRSKEICLINGLNVLILINPSIWWMWLREVWLIDYAIRIIQWSYSYSFVGREWQPTKGERKWWVTKISSSFYCIYLFCYWEVIRIGQKWMEIN